MGILLEEFNLIRYAIDFDPETMDQRRVERGELPEDAFVWGNHNSPIEGCFADIGGERVFLYGVPSNEPNIFGRYRKRIFHTSDGHKIEIGANLRTEFEPRTDLSCKGDERWMEFRLIDDATRQLRYKAIYDVMPILKMYWQDFTPYIEYKDWDFYAYLKDIVDPNREAAVRVAKGLPPDPYGDSSHEPEPKPALPFPERLRRLPGDEVPVTGYWWSPAFLDSEKTRHFEQGAHFPSTRTTAYGDVVWYFDPERQPPEV